MRFDNQDFKRGWKECDDCKERIWKLEAGFDAPESLCELCNCYTCKKEDFKAAEGAEILSKG